MKQPQLVAPPQIQPGSVVLTAPPSPISVETDIQPLILGAERVMDALLCSLRSDHTRKAYRRTIVTFMKWLTSQPVYEPVSAQTIRQWLDARRTEGASGSTRNQSLAALRAFMRQAEEMDLIDQKMLSRMLNIKSDRSSTKKIGNWLTDEQVNKLLLKPNLRLRGMRDHAMLCLMIGCGLRRSELVGLRLQDIQQREGRWVIPDLIGKGGKRRTVPVPSGVKARIDQYVEKAKTSLLPDQYLFRIVRRNRLFHDRPLSTQMVMVITNQYGKKIGINKLAPHDLRRTYARLARRSGGDLDQIQATLGHSNVSTTQIYVGDNQNLQNAPGDMIAVNW